MLRLYLGGAAGLVLFGQTTAGQTGQQLLDQALTSDPSLGVIMNEAGKIASLGIQPTDAAVIVAASGLVWKLLDTQQKSGLFETLNLWARRKLKVDDPPPPTIP
jgi:hypothetical protein